MENVADALKIVAAVSIFALACFMLFRVATTAREAAAFSLTEVDRDGYVYMEDSEYIHNGNRLVLWSQVWANIQNYDQRSVGITIIKDDKIIARFDMKTEDTINQWKLIRDENEDGTPNDKEKLVDYYNEYITTPAGITSFDSVEKLEELFEKIYNIKGGGSNDKFLCPWFGNYNETKNWL